MQLWPNFPNPDRGDGDARAEANKRPKAQCPLTLPPRRASSPNRRSHAIGMCAAANRFWMKVPTRAGTAQSRIFSMWACQSDGRSSPVPLHPPLHARRAGCLPGLRPHDRRDHGVGAGHGRSQARNPRGGRSAQILPVRSARPALAGKECGHAPLRSRGTCNDMFGCRNSKRAESNHIRDRLHPKHGCQRPNPC